MPLIIPANTLSGGYDVANSARWGGTDNEYMGKTLGTPSNTKKMTWSFWTKKTRNENDGHLATVYGDGSNYGTINFTDANKFQVFQYISASIQLNLITTQVFRDNSAWSHFVIQMDTTQSTASNRCKVWHNGSQITDWATETYWAQDTAIKLNEASATLRINAVTTSSVYHGYVAEFIMCDGQTYQASDFGEYNSNTPTIWQPKDPSDLTFGTNGFWLDFKDSANLGNDANGGTDFSETNFAATDQATDTPTNNFCTLSPLFNFDGSYTLSEGNLKFLGTGGNDGTASTMAVSSGRWYWECEFDGVANTAAAGFSTAELVANIGTSNPLAIFVGVSYFGNSINFNSSGTSGTASDGDIYGFYLDLEADSGSKTLKIYQNGSLFATETIPTAREGENFIPIVADASSTDSTLIANFGNPILALSSANADANGYGSFEYSPTLSGVNYYAMCTKNLAEFG